MTNAKKIEKAYTAIFKVIDKYRDIIDNGNISDGIANRCIRAYMIFSTGAR